jgi:hypothetical protein
MNFRSRSLLNLAHKLHTCTRCGHYVPEGLEPAHSDSSRHGKGMGLKSGDEFHAALCHACHTELPNLPRADREDQWQRAFEATLTEYWQRGWLKVCIDRGD